MARKPAPLNPWQEMEEQAYHAYREWPVFLKMRLRALRRHLPPEAFASNTSGQTATASSPDPVKEDIELLKEYGLIVPEKSEE